MNYIGNKPWSHQEVAIKRALKEKEFAFFFDPGTGKTFTTINVLRHKYRDRLMRTLILAPPVVLENWRDEFYKYSEYGDKCLVLNGPSVKRKKVFEKYVQYHPIVITNYEAMGMKSLYQDIKNWNPEIIVMDESHKLKSHKSMRAKQVQVLCDQSIYRYQLTGTPILQGEMDLFMQFRCLDQGRTLGKNFYAFQKRYFRDANEGWNHKHNHFPKYVPRESTIEDLRALVKQKSMVVEKKSCLDLPPMIRQILKVEMSDAQRIVYNEMRDYFISFINDNKDEPQAIVANMALTKALRLQQIVSGFVKFADGRELAFDKNPRITALSEILSSLTKNHKVIVWANFKNNYIQIARVCNDLKINFRELHGDISQKDQQKNIDDFRRNDKCRVLIANQGSGGIGINLVEASYSIYFSRSFSLEHDIQSEARNYRGGSHIHDKITRIDLVCPGTIDDIVLEALEKKQKISDQILDLGEKL